MKYIGHQTKLALENFPFPVEHVSLELIHAISKVKKAAALTNKKINKIDPDIASAIVLACDEIKAGKHNEEFMTPEIQGGAGTSINMNVNEVIANRATEILKHKKIVHANDHVNLFQSTNDVNPSALRIATIRLVNELDKALEHLIKVFEQKTKNVQNVPKLARTHVQDAVPTTFGQEFGSYIATIKRDKKRIQEAAAYLYDLNLGGTAIGNSISAPKEYIDNIYPILSKITNIKLKKAENLMSLTSSGSDFCHLSAMLTILYTDLAKIANDIRFLASGPYGGIGEIILKDLQPGSSIMPGKVNPIIPESINQIAYTIAGKHVALTQAAENAHLELAVMFPIVAESIVSSLKIAKAGVMVFADKCIAVMQVNPKKAKEYLEKSTAYAVLLTPVLGYDVVSNVVKESVKTQTSIRQVILKRKLLTEKEFIALTGAKK